MVCSSQAIPALRPATADELGCNWGRGAERSLSMRTQPLCVIVMGRDATALSHARANLLLLRQDTLRSTKQSDAAGPLSNLKQAILEDRVQFAWVDAQAQRTFCLQHLAASDGEQGWARRGMAGSLLASQVCGRSYLDRAAAAAAAGRAVVKGDWKGAKNIWQGPPPAAVLLAISQQWQPSAHRSKRNSGGYAFDVSNVNMAVETLGLHELHAAAAWISSCLGKLKSTQAAPAGVHEWGKGSMAPLHGELAWA